MHKCLSSPAGRLDGSLDELYQLVGPENSAVNVRDELVEAGVEMRHHRLVLLLQDAQLDHSNNHRVLPSIALPN